MKTILAVLLALLCIAHAHAQKEFYVKEPKGLAIALQAATAGDRVVVAAPMDLTVLAGTAYAPPFNVHAGVTVLGLPGAAMHYNRYFPSDAFQALFITDGADATFDGLEIWGPSGDIKDHDYARRGDFCSIKIMNARATVRNCRIMASDKWGIWAYFADGLLIANNYIEGVCGEGYGYGIFVTGIDFQFTGGAVYAEAVIENNYFNRCRVAIDGSGHIKKMIIRNNVFGPSMHYNVVQLHPSNGTRNIYGGGDAEIVGNTWLSTQKNLNWPWPLDTNKYTIYIANNRFSRAVNDVSEPAALVGGIGILAKNDRPWVKDEGNYYNNEKQGYVPIAKIDGSTVSGTAPLTVDFKGWASYGEEGRKIVGYRWRFADGDWTGNSVEGPVASYTFTEPGVYEVSLTVCDDAGVYSRPTFWTVTVSDPKIKHPFTFWCKDSYEDSLYAGRYVKQALFDDKLVWSDDVSGNEGWQHVELDLDKYGLADGKQHKFQFRMLCKTAVQDPSNDMKEIMIWLDGVWAGQNGSLSPAVGSLETGVFYPPWNQRFYYVQGAPAGTSGISTVVTTDEARTGLRSLRIRIPFLGKTVAGMWGEFYVPFTVK